MDEPSSNGIDISLPLSLVVAAVLYLALLRIFPEPLRRVRARGSAAGPHRRGRRAADHGGGSRS